MFSMVLALVLNFAYAKTSPASKLSCTARELRGEDCRLVSGTYQIRLLSETIARDDGTWHTVDPMPLAGADVTWQKITFEVQHGLPLLQLWLWDGGKGEAQVQALHWYVGDARKGALRILSEGVVRRRRLKPPEETAADPKKTPTFLYDGWEKHSVKIMKNGKLDWQLGAQKKTLDPDAPMAKPPPEKGH